MTPITHDALIKRGFVLCGVEEDDPYYRLTLDHEFHNMAGRNTFTGSFWSDGNFHLYGFGHITLERLDEILRGIELICGAKMKDIIYSPESF